MSDIESDGSDLQHVKRSKTTNIIESDSSDENDIRPIATKEIVVTSKVLMDSSEDENDIRGPIATGESMVASGVLVESSEDENVTAMDSQLEEISLGKFTEVDTMTEVESDILTETIEEPREDEGYVTIEYMCTPSKKFTVPLSAARMSVTISNFLDDMGEDSQPIPITWLPDCPIRIFDMIVEYMIHYRTDPTKFVRELEEKDKETGPLCSYDKRMVGRCSINELFGMMIMANFLDLSVLLDLLAYRVSTFMKGKTPEEIRKIFNITSILSKEEHTEMTRNIGWIETAGI